MLGDTFAWWLAVEVIGFVGLPLSWVVFRNLPDRGYAFAKPVGILLGGYLFWLALTANVLPNRAGSAFWCFLLLAAASGYIYLTRKQEIHDGLRDRIAVVLAVEAIFTLGFFVAAFLRSYVPEIEATEKPMDFMFLNAASRSRYYPPEDPWLAGFAVSYYYFGYVLQAMVGKLAGLATSVTYNVALASTAALAMTAAFGVGYNLVAAARRAVAAAIIAGIAAAVLVAVLGNLEGALEFAKANGYGSDAFFRKIDIANLAGAPASDSWYPSDRTSFWWWWRATRVCPDAHCIMEFPFFSFLLGDLHPHVMAIPFALTAVGLAIGFWLARGPLDLDSWVLNPPLLLATGLLQGGLGFLNTWDLPTFGSLATLVVLARNLREHRTWPRAIGATIGFMGPVVAVAVVGYLPFYLTFHSQAEGLEPVTGDATRPLHAAIIWLPLALVAAPVPLVRVVSDAASRTRPRLAMVLAAPAALLMLWAALIATGDGSLGDAITDRGWNWTSALAFGALFTFSALALWREAERPAAEDDEGSGLAPMLAMTAVASMLLFGAEFFFIGDVFNSRLNTVFKLYYQAWLLLGCAGAFGLYWLAREWPVRRGSIGETVRGAWGGVTAVALLGALLYPLGATLSRTDGLGGRERTLDGLAAAARHSADDMGAVDWLRRNAYGDDVILEGVLGQYSLGGRIAARTGVPTVLGWAGHEIQWGRDPALVAAREADVNRAYTSTSLAEALEILRRYNVTYVIVGSVERTKYPAAGLQKFSDSLPSAYSRGNLTIFRVPPAEPRVESGRP
ncbi:MAG TPA: DUF2298 domain-containing protein [Dehalococcoidia bacterium]|nr:DUF2298 domain-containing protein [Dehalococcoidia bacterium]